MEKQYKLTDRVSKDSLKSSTFKKWLKRVLCFACILSLALQLAMCVAPMSASALESTKGVWTFNPSCTPADFDLRFQFVAENGVTFYGMKARTSQINGQLVLDFYTASDSTATRVAYSAGSWNNSYYDVLEILEDVNNSTFVNWLTTNAVRSVTDVYDFTGEYRLFNEQLTGLSFAQAGTVTQTYQFDYRIWNGYSADYFTIQATGSQVNIRYSFIDDGSGGVTTVYRQLLRDGNIVGTWLVPRARLIYFESNPDDTMLQQWLLDNTTLVDESMLQTVYDFGYNNGFNDGWTDNLIGDTLNAPIQALNNITLLQVGNTVITLGGVIFTMIVLCILIVFLKKFAGG